VDLAQLDTLISKIYPFKDSFGCHTAHPMSPNTLANSPTCDLFFFF